MARQRITVSSSTLLLCSMLHTSPFIYHKNWTPHIFSNVALLTPFALVECFHALTPNLCWLSSSLPPIYPFQIFLSYFTFPLIWFFFNALPLHSIHCSFAPVHFFCWLWEFSWDVIARTRGHSHIPRQCRNQLSCILVASRSVNQQVIH